MNLAIPRPASTVVLIRQASRGIEVFLVRRHYDIAFMGGAHVFPGGRVEQDDANPDLVHLSDGMETTGTRLVDVAAPEAVAFHIAAVRETFEEAGVLLARHRDGAMVSFAEIEGTELMAHRKAIADGATTLVDLLRARDWRLALDTLAYAAHWVTPEIETRRFDTRFFLAVVPPQQVAAHDAGETTEGVWLAPADAIAQCLGGEIALPPPTWTTLRWLEPFDTVAAAMTWARSKPVPRIEPGFIVLDDTRIITLPGDVTMPAVQGFEARETRFELRAGRWRPGP